MNGLQIMYTLSHIPSYASNLSNRRLSSTPSYASILSNPYDPKTRSGDILLCDKPPTLIDPKRGGKHRMQNKRTGFWDDYSICSKKTIVPGIRDLVEVNIYPRTPSLIDLNASIALEKAQTAIQPADASDVESIDWDRYSYKWGQSGKGYYLDKVTGDTYDNPPSQKAKVIPAESPFSQAMQPTTLHPPLNLGTKRSIRRIDSQRQLLEPIPKRRKLATTHNEHTAGQTLPETTSLKSASIVTPSRSQSPAKGKEGKSPWQHRL